jgi:hypothetical protein
MEHLIIIKHFSIFVSFLNQIEQFLCHLRVTNVHWKFLKINKLKKKKNREMQKTQEGRG